MDNIIISFNVVFPILVLLVTGYILNRMNLLSERTANQMNKIVFKVFLPCMLFTNVYNSDISGGFNINIVWWSVSFIVGIFILLCLILPIFIKDKRKISVVVQGCFRSNFVLYGVPVTLSLLGSSNVSVVAVLIAIIIPLYNLLAILDFQIFHPDNENKKDTGSKFKSVLQFLKKFILGIITNPLILSSFVGLLFLWLRTNGQSVIGFNVELPESIYSAINNFGKIATPLSFIVLGSTLKFSSVKHNVSLLSFTVIMRLFIIPAIGIFFTYLLGFRGTDFVALMVMLSTPNAVSSFTMAAELGGDPDLAGEIVIFTSTFSIISLFLIIFTCKSLGLF